MNITFFNIENLFYFHHKKHSYQCSPAKLLHLKKAFEDLDADIYCLCEIGGAESLINFNKDYLDDNYVISLIPGNSDRGIELSYLIHKRVLNKYSYFQKSNKEYLLPLKNNHTEPSKFSRDVAEFHLFEGTNNTPLLILLGVHLKSQLDSEGKDPQGRFQRTAEVLGLIEIYSHISKQNPNTPILIMGDFNGIAQKEHSAVEFLPIYEQTPLLDIFEITKLPLEERNTFKGRPPYETNPFLQLDYIFLDPKFASLFDGSKIHRFTDVANRPLVLSSIPSTTWPSDHNPISIVLK